MKGFSPDALAAIEAFDWPGNVRELESRIKAAVIMAEGSLLTAPDLGLAAVPAAPPLTLREARAEAERRAILGALEDMQGNMSAAAERMGISRPTLYDLIERLVLQGMEGK